MDLVTCTQITCLQHTATMQRVADTITATTEANQVTLHQHCFAVAISVSMTPPAQVLIGSLTPRLALPSTDTLHGLALDVTAYVPAVTGGAAAAVLRIDGDTDTGTSMRVRTRNTTCLTHRASAQAARVQINHTVVSNRKLYG